MAILLLSLLPYSAKSFNMTRIYHIALFGLSPLFIFGGIFVIEKIIRIIDIKNNLKQSNVVLVLILVILTPYFLFNTGFIYEMTKDVPTSISLGMERMKNDNTSKFNFYNTYTPEQDVYSARWYYKNKDSNKKIYADSYSQLHVLNSYGNTPQYDIHSPFKGDKLYELNFVGNYYIYFNMFSVCGNTFVDYPNGLIFNTSVFYPLINKSSKIYSNGCGEIYEK